MEEVGGFAAQRGRESRYHRQIAGASSRMEDGGVLFLAQGKGPINWGTRVDPDPATHVRWGHAELKCDQVPLKSPRGALWEIWDSQNSTGRGHLHAFHS